MTCAERFVPNPKEAAASTNVMDAWIQAALQGLVEVRHVLPFCFQWREGKHFGNEREGIEGRDANMRGSAPVILSSSFPIASIFPNLFIPLAEAFYHV